MADHEKLVATVAGQRPQKTVISGRYRLIEEIGRGNMGKVYRVEHVHTGETFAMKVLGPHIDTDPAMIERFKREARTPALIRSEHVVKVIDADAASELGGAPFLVMELLDGVDLEKFALHTGKLPAADVVRILSQVAKALDKAHAIGIVHRDLKPANIFMHRREDGVVVKLLDFGISKLGASQDAARITASGAIMGTPLYMPPEQATGQTAIGPAADVWAMGMLAFRLLSGRTYWSMTTMAELMAAIVRDPVSAPLAGEAGLPPAFEAWFLQSCHRAPEARFASAGEQVQKLAAALEVPLVGSSSSAELLASVGRTLVSAGGAARPVETVVDLIPTQSAPPALASAVEQRSALPPASVEGERRQVTVLSLEMTLSALGGGEVDPEDLRDVTAGYQTACAEILGQLGSPVTQTMGDGVLVYFGYPAAQGDDAKRAVQAGLRIADAAKRIHERVSRSLAVALSLRAGVHTGLVVTGDLGSQPDVRNVVGQVPQIASQLKRSAPANAVAISAATHRLVKAQFVCQPLSTAIEGTAADAFQVTSEASLELMDSVDGRLAPLVGREIESALLLEKFRDLASGQGHVVLLTGEAGIGKSSVIRSFRQAISGEPVSWLECRCSPYFDSTALHPVMEMLKRMMGIGPDDSARDKAAKVWAFARQEDVEKDAPLFGWLLGIPLEDASLVNQSPQLLKQRTRDAISSLLLRMTQRRQVVLVVDDLHWVDPSTLELLSALVDEGPSAGILLVLTARNEFSSPWGSRGHIAQLSLSRLTKPRMEALILQVSGGKPLPAVVVQEILTKTDGVPLFVEELTRDVLEAPFLKDAGTHFTLAGPLPALGVPGTLRDSLTSRLDRLGSAKATAQMAATLGREFDYDMLLRVTGSTDAELSQDLRVLVDGELLYQRGKPPAARYMFKHSLVQDTAYESLLKNARRQAHGRIAGVLVSEKPELCETQPEILAHHRAAAGQPIEAAADLLRAGQRALERSANAESIAHLTRAIELCESAPDSGTRAELEPTLRTLLGVPLMMTKGYGAPEVEQTYAKALSLANDAEGKQLLPVLWGLWIFYHVRANYRTAWEISDKLLALADRSGDSTVQVAAHLARGSTSLLTARYEAARRHLELSIHHYDAAAHRGHAYMFGQDSLVFARAMLSWTLWLTGLPDQALRVSAHAVSWARELGHPNTLAFALGMAAALHQYRGERPQVESFSSELIAMAGPQGLLHWLSEGRILHGWATSGPTTENEGLVEMREGRAVWSMIGARVADTHWDAMIAERLMDDNQRAEGLALVAKMKAFVEDSDERSFEPEVHRLEGEMLLLEPGHEVEAEACFERAIDLAKRQGARSLLLRASTSLARMWTAASKSDRAAELLRPVWSSFQEGLGTRDLVRAKAVLSGVFL